MDKIDGDSKRIIVATSIAPFNIENQKNAIDTWIKSGLEVVSFNCPEEYEIVSRFFPNIRFEIVHRDGRDRFGKPYVFFDDVMEFFKDCNYNVCGIINSDIYLFGFDKKRIYDEASDSLVFGPRMEISSLNDLTGIVCYGGYDYFFFYRGMASIYPKSDFCIGLPVWDHWIAFVPLINRIVVKELMVPSAFHLKHDIKWKWDIVSAFVEEIYNRYYDKLGYYEEFMDRDKKQINFEKIFNKHAKKLITADNSWEKSILVVSKGSDDRTACERLQKQTYSNFRVIREEDLELDSVEEELIYFLKDGVELDSSFLEMMAYHIDKKDNAVAGFQVKNYHSIFFENIYPFNFEKKQIDSEAIDECIVYRTDFYKLHGLDKTKILFHNCALVGRGLVQIDYRKFVLEKKLKQYEGHKICIYAAGGHTRKLLQEVDFSKFEIIAIFDSDITFDGTEIDGYKVCHKSRIGEFSFDYILISSQSFEEQIYEELLKYVESDKIIRIYGN